VVNQLKPKDLASALKQGKITDVSIIKTSSLEKAVNHDITLLDNPKVMNEMDQRAQSDISLLNDNPKIKERWFSSNGITDAGATLESYNGKRVKTSGYYPTTFNINDHPGATVNADGTLTLQSGTQIKEAEMDE